MSLSSLLFSRARLAVLNELSKVPDGLHLRELERRSGLNKHGLARELHSLRDAGVLASERIGRQVIYRLNPDCPIYDELRSILRKTVGLVDVLREALEPLSDRIELAYVYGSHARGDERADSDVDLMIVGEATLRELSPLLREMTRDLRRDVNPTVYPASEYREALEDPGSFVARVHAGPRLDLIGGKR